MQLKNAASGEEAAFFKEEGKQYGKQQACKNE